MRCGIGSDDSVGSISACKRQVNAVVPLDLVNIIDERADALTMTRGKFAALIFAWWEAQGCPAVTTADEAVLILKRGRSGKK